MLLGKEENGSNIYISPKERSTHMHVIGSTGEGKSKFLEHMIRQDIINNNGLCLIDPHGSLYDNTLNWLVTLRLLEGKRPKKVILFDPSEEQWSFGFNPLRLSSSYLSYHVDAMVRATAKVWGDEDINRTPRLRKCLRLLFHVLAEKKLTLTESLFLLNARDTTVREYLTQNIESDVIRQEWNYFNTTQPRAFYEQFESTSNRMMEFLSSPIIAHTIGQLETPLNLRKIMDEGYVLLVNLATKGKISEDNARLLGTLLVNDLFMHAKDRDEKTAKPFYLYIDECADYINEDIGRILNQARKFGLHLTLAHQHLGQLLDVGRGIYNSVMTDAKTKVVFGGLSPDDAEELTKLVFLDELDPERPKTALTKPVVVGYIRTWLNSYSSGSSSTSGTSHNQGRAVGSNWHKGSSSLMRVNEDDFLCGSELVATGETEGSGGSESEIESDGSFSSTSTSKSRGKAQALQPILEERPSGGYYSPEEQINQAMALMVNQPERHAIIKLPKKSPNFIEVPFVKSGYAGKERIEETKQKCFRTADFTKAVVDIEAEIMKRHLAIEQQANALAEVRARGIATVKAKIEAGGNTKEPQTEPEQFKEDPQPEPDNFRD